MKYHILTPFNREENLILLLGNFKQPNVVFHPLIDRPIEFPEERWIKPFTFKPDPGIKRITFHAWNKFFDSGNLIDDDYYMFLSDDDFLEPDFFEKIKDIKTDVILVSMKLGDHITASRYGTGTRIPHWHLLQRSRIGTEQLIAKGKILKNERFHDLYNADGLFIGTLYRHNPHRNFTFKTDAYVWFNYLEPGRWDRIRNRFELAKQFGKLGFKKGAEIGVNEGRYSEILCQSIPGLKLTCIDIWPKQETLEIAKARLKPYDVTLIKASSMDVAKQIPDGSLDFVFIDANHSYEAVRDDIREWTKKVRHGGIVSGHDYFVFFWSHNRGVMDAVNEYVEKHHYELRTTDKDLEVEHRDDRPPCWYFYKVEKA